MLIQRNKDKHNNKQKFQKWLIYIGEILEKVMLKIKPNYFCETSVIYIYF